MPQLKNNVLNSVIQLFRFFKLTGIRLRYLPVSVVLTFFSVIFNLLGLRLLIALLRGVINQDFRFVGQFPIFKNLIRAFPNTFNDSSLFFLLVITLFILSLARGILEYLASFCSGYQSRQVKTRLRNFILDRYLAFGKLSYDRISTGQLNSIMAKLPETIASQLTALQRILGQIFSLIAYFAVMIAISWKLAFLVLLIFPIFVIPLAVIKYNRRSAVRSHAASQEKFDKKIFNILSSIALVKAQAMEDEEKKRFAQDSGEEIDLEFKLDRTEMLISPAQEMMIFSAFLILIVALKLMLPSVKGGEVAKYFVFFYLVRLSLPGFPAISNLSFTLARMSIPVNRLLELLHKEKMFTIRAGSKEFQGIKRGIVFNNLHFSYRTQQKVLTDISSALEYGKMTAIVGPTGAGKTTILNLLLRFYDCPEQSILVDGIDIREFTLKSIMARMAYVSQEPLLFDDTLRANLTYGLNGNISDCALDDVAKKTHLYDFIYSLPEKWDTYIGDRGVQLSGGERQRVSIARALLKNSDILLLDEATSALDVKTERLIREAIREAVKGKTTVVIAHRFSTIKHADNIIVIDAGRIVEQGAFKELIDKKGRFWEYCNEQLFF